MKLKLLASITFLIMLVGCAPNQSPAQMKPIATQSTITIATPTSNILEATPTEPIPTSENWEKAKSCVTVYPSIPMDHQLAGVVAVRSLSSKVLGLSLSLFDLGNGISKGIDTAKQSIWEADVSPNRKTLAYEWFNDATSNWELRLIDATGKPQKVAWSSDDDFGFGGWMNDHQLVIKEGATYIVIDPYQGSQLKFLLSDFPDFNTYHADFFAAFDPLFAKAIYRDGAINILDLSTNTIITRIEDGYDRTPIVDWQPSGKRAAIATTISIEKAYVFPDEIFILENDGQVKQLTHLYESFGRILTIQNMRWSPNGEKIAFWVYDGEGNITLMIANALSGEVTNYCILNVTSDLFPIYLPAPIWSPDGNQLLVENRYTSDESNLLVVDLVQRVAFPIAKNENPIGWMVKP